MLGRRQIIPSTFCSLSTCFTFDHIVIYEVLLASVQALNESSLAHVIIPHGRALVALFALKGGQV